MLRRACAEGAKRLSLLSSDSGSQVDRRIVVKLLTTFFERGQSPDILNLMTRMLGFTGTLHGLAPACDMELLPHWLDSQGLPGSTGVYGHVPCRRGSPARSLAFRQGSCAGRSAAAPAKLYGRPPCTCPVGSLQQRLLLDGHRRSIKAKPTRVVLHLQAVGCMSPPRPCMTQLRSACCR